MGLAIGLLVAGGCGVETVPTGRVTPQSSTVQTSSTTTSSSAPPTTTATPTPTPERFVAPTTDLGEVSKQVDPPPSKTRPKTTTTADCGSDHYRNTDGVCVHRPATGPGAANGATALCKDGSYSYSQNRRGTCSGHGGVRTWL